jgi:succinyl-diaminopimelate desuccinylase
MRVLPSSSFRSGKGGPSSSRGSAGGGAADRLPLGFTGHLDIVPLGAQPWSADPFAGDIADGKLYGRGSSDMKSGVAAFVTA